MDAFNDLARATRRWPVWLRYAVAVLLALCSAWVRDALDEHLGEHNPFLVFYPAIFFSAFVLDRGSGVVCTVASALLGVYFFIEPRGSFGLLGVGNVIAVSIFIGVGLLAAFIIEALHVKAVALRDALDRAKRAEAEKTELLHEANHRIKNKLQFVASLLTLQSHGATPETQAALRAAIERVVGIGRVTDLLAYREAQSSVDAREFIGSLCSDLQLGLVGARPIALAVEVQPVAMALGQASLVGLIVNELVTNALKHAFGDDQPGRVTVRLARGGDGTFHLSVADNGKGLDGSRIGNGQRLVRLLVAQLDGELRVEKPDGPGAAFLIAFPAGRGPGA